MKLVTTDTRAAIGLIIFMEQTYFNAQGQGKTPRPCSGLQPQFARGIGAFEAPNFVVFSICMPGYTEEEKDQIIRAYLGPAGGQDPPACPHCGENLGFTTDRSSDRFQVHVRCADCSAAFTWGQRRPVESWSDLHLQYFLERYQAAQALRCPVDDSLVLYIEFSDGVLEFRCPYCNRRGRAAKPDSPNLHTQEASNPGVSSR